MKKLIFLLCIIIIPAVLNSQEKDKEYREFLDEIQKDFNSMEERSNFEFENFIDSMNIEWLQLLKEAEKEFSDLLSGSFREYTSEIPEKLPEVKKPEQITNYKVTPGVGIDTDSIKRTPFIKGITEVFLFHELPAGISSGTLLSASLKFLDTVFTIQFDPKLKELPEISHPDPGRIKKCYDFLLNTDYQPVLNQILLLCDQLNLNDWDYFCLLNEFSLSVFEEPNAQKVIAWFLLIQSNYKAKIGYSNDNLSVLLAIDQTLYDIPWFNINGERYYAFKCDGKKIKTYDIEHFKGHKYLSVFHARPFLLEGNKSERIVTFPYDGKDYSIALEYDQNTVNYYTDFPGMDVDYYFSLPVSQTFKESVENRIAPFLINKSRSDALRFLLSLVQYGFDYKTDEEQFNKEKYMVPEEVLFYNYSDCDDRTILFSYLVKSLLNLDVIALDFKGHICSAVDVTNTGLNWNLTYDNREFVICDPTYIGAPPGVLLPEYQVNNAIIIDIRKNLERYNLSKKIWGSVISEGLMQADNSGSNIIINGSGIYMTGMISESSKSEAEDSLSGSGSTTTFVARRDTLNRAQWIKIFKGSAVNSGYCIAESGDDYLYVFGFFKDTLSVDTFRITSHEEGSFYLAKFDHSGNAHWLRNIYLPQDSSSQGITTVFSAEGEMKYYMPNDHFPHKEKYIMDVDANGYCYIYAMIPGIVPGEDLNKYFADGGNFDLVSYLINGNNNLIKQDYPKSVAFLYTLLKYLNNNGAIIQGTSLVKAVSSIYDNMENGIPVLCSEVGKISELINNEGITWIKTVAKQPVTIKHLQAIHDSRIKLSFVNGNARIDVLYGIKRGNGQIWNDVNFIMIDKTSGEITCDYDNRYQKKMPIPSQLL